MGIIASELLCTTPKIGEMLHLHRFESHSCMLDKLRLVMSKLVVKFSFQNVIQDSLVEARQELLGLDHARAQLLK
jgi:hypothetical protein